MVCRKRHICGGIAQIIHKASEKIALPWGIIFEITVFIEILWVVFCVFTYVLPDIGEVRVN